MLKLFPVKLTWVNIIPDYLEEDKNVHFLQSTMEAASRQTDNP